MTMQQSMSGWWSALRDNFDAVSAVVAPHVETQLDTFRKHWLEIKKFYIDKKDSVEGFHEASLPQHFIRLFRLLIEEEESVGQNFQGPCMEFFLREKIFDIPPGFRKMTMTLVAEFLHEIRQPVLQHQAIHRGVVNLIIAAQKCSDTERGVFVDLVCAVAARLANNTHLVGFFFRQDEHVFASNFPVFLPFHMLLQRIEDSGSVSERALDGLMTCMRLQDDSVVRYITERANVSTQLVGRAATLLRNAAQQAKQGDEQALNVTCARLRALFSACNAIISANHAVSENVARDFEQQVLYVVLGPGLLQRDDKIASVYTRQLAQLVQIATSQLQDIVIAFIFGDDDDDDDDNATAGFRSANASQNANAGASSASQSDGGPLLPVLLRRLRSTDTVLLQRTLHLFDSLVATYRATVLRKLALHYVRGGRFLARTTTGTMHFEHVQNALTAFLRVLPGQKYASESDYRSYIADAQDGAAQALRALEVESVARHCDVTRLLEPTSVTPSNGDGSSGGAFNEGPFFGALFDILENCFQHTLEVNLLCTSILNRLARVPHAATMLHEYLLDPLAPLRPGVRSLYSILVSLSKHAERRTGEAEHVMARLMMLRNELPDVHVNAAESSDATFLYALIVLVEFCKELAGVIQVKFFARTGMHGQRGVSNDAVAATVGGGGGGGGVKAGAGAAAAAAAVTPSAHMNAAVHNTPMTNVGALHSPETKTSAHEFNLATPGASEENV